MHDLSNNNDIVWLTEDRRFAVLIYLGAHYSMVAFDLEEGERILIANDEFEFWEERAIDYE